MKGMPLRLFQNFCEKVRIGVPFFMHERLCADHGTIRMTGIEVIVIAVADMVTDGMDDRVVVIRIQTWTDDEIFFRCLFQTDSLSVFGYLRQFT